MPVRELRDKIKLFGVNGEAEVEALFDTGSPIGYVSKDIAEKVGMVIYPEEQDVTMGDTHIVKMKPALGIVEIKGCRKPILTFINENPLSEIVIGMHQMEGMGIKIDTQTGYTVSCERPRA